jgi:hypothetical protein
VLADGFRHFHEFVFAELAVFIFVELLEHLGWVRSMGTAGAHFPGSACAPAFALTGLTASASSVHFAHLFFCFGAFRVV